MSLLSGESKKGGKMKSPAHFAGKNAFSILKTAKYPFMFFGKKI